MPRQLRWERDGADWPHREASRFVQAAQLRWHVQTLGTQAPDAPRILLLHGTGASTHSWRALMELLAPHGRVTALDLPGHGFTELPAPACRPLQCSLPGMARAIEAVLQAIGEPPDLVVGHSAGAALAVRMCLDGMVRPASLLSINGALLPWGGVVGPLLSPVARLMAAVPLVPRLFARHATDPAVVQRLIDGTGSTLDAAGQDLYARLVRDPGHAAGALAMMAHWDLRPLARDLPRLQAPLHLAVGALDRTVAPSQSQEVLALLPPARPGRVHRLAGLGHLAHEERPDLAADLVLRQAAAAGFPG